MDDETAMLRFPRSSQEAKPRVTKKHKIKQRLVSATTDE